MQLPDDTSPPATAPSPAAPAEALPEHLEMSVNAIAAMHEEHQESKTRHERAFEAVIHGVARPGFVYGLTAAVLAWIALNLAMPALGWRAIDPMPFPWLQGALTLTALYLALAILSTQRRDDQLASRRDQMTLELAILNEQKAAKIIRLIEALREDSPAVRDRVDHEARAMAEPADLQAVDRAIREGVDRGRPA